MDAFSKANEYWDVGFCVNASNLSTSQSVDGLNCLSLWGQDGKRALLERVTYHVKDILICCSSTGNLRSRSSS